jgi:ketosteroid isomerase-like protein
MKFMRRRNLRLFAVAALLPFMTLNVPAQSNKGAAKISAAESAISQQLTQIVRNFLAEVPKGDRQTFENFFADDVIYTRSAGVTVDKAEILRNIDARAVNEPHATYAGDDFTVHDYGNMAVVNFRLVQHNEKDGKQETNYFRNTGTFLKRNGKWQVVAWQATKIAGSGEAK